MNKTKLKILSGAQQLFLDNGYHGTALDKLLQVIDVSKGSFFYHFKSKDSLLSEVVDLEAENLFNKLEEFFSESTNPLNSLNKFLSWRLQNFTDTGRLIYKLGSEVGRTNFTLQKKIKKIYGEYLSFLIKIIDEAKRNGQLVKSTPTKELANFILHGLEGGTMSIALIDNEKQYHDVVEMMKRVVRSYRVLDLQD